jgi:hypothetical protein
MASFADYPGGYHAVVMEYYQRLVMKYNKNIYFPVRKHPAKTRLYIDSRQGNEDHNEVDSVVKTKVLLQVLLNM